MVLATLGLGGTVGVRAAAAEAEPENLAPKAKVSASDQDDHRFAPQFAVDGQIALNLLNARLGSGE